MVQQAVILFLEPLVARVERVALLFQLRVVMEQMAAAVVAVAAVVELTLLQAALAVLEPTYLTQLKMAFLHLER
jgi:hypothetical protein